MSPELSSAILIDAFDSVPAGHLMIRDLKTPLPTPAVLEVPTLNEVALVILAVLLGLLGAVVVRRL